MIKLHTAFRNTYDFHVKLQLRRCELPFIYLFYALIALSVFPTRGTGVALHCSNEIILTSPNFPSYYPNGASEEWYITAPSQRRILVTFNDFSLEDFFDAIMIEDMENLSNRRRYTGDNMLFPPFLTLGHTLYAVFTSSKNGIRKGFNISVSCYKPSTSSGRLVGGASSREGFLELSSHSGEWMRVCEESLPAEVAGVICGELGYPGVKEISFENDTCLSDDTMQNCTRAPQCKENMYRLQDCTPVHLTCSSDKAVKMKCLEPGYRGCYELEMKPQNGFPFDSTAHCLSSCKTGKVQAIAIMSNMECFCSTAPEVSLESRTKLSDSECTQRTETESSASQSKAGVYNASVGFCDELNDTLGGFWDSNITWFGSIVHLKCMNGYGLNGSGTLQCVPGLTPYYPVWNDSISTCDEIKVSTLFSESISTAVTPYHRPTTEKLTDLMSTDGMNKVIIGVSIGVTVPLLVFVCIAVFIAVFIYRKRGSCHSRKRSSQQRPGQADGTQSTHPTRRERAVTTNSRRSRNGPSTGSTARRFNGPPNRRTNDPSAPIFVIPPAVPNNLPHDSRPSGALSTPTSSNPSSTSNRPFRLLHQNNPRSDNHYISSKSDPNQHYYSSSSDNQRGASTRPEEAYQEQFTANIINHAYEDTTNDQGLSNAMLANLNPYYYASNSDTPRVASTYATCGEEEYQEPSTVEMANHTYDCPTDQGQSNTLFGNRLTGFSMISRPLPHRPSSSNNCTEGPTLPPRKTHIGSVNAPPASAFLKQRKSAMINENNSLLEACSSDFIVIQDLPKKHITSNKLMRQPQTPLYLTREKDEQQRRDVELDNLETPTPITLKGDRQDPFYHCLENNNNHSSDSENIQFLHDEQISTFSQDNSDVTDSIRMIDNILYTPLPSHFVQRNITQL